MRGFHIGFVFGKVIRVLNLKRADKDILLIRVKVNDNKREDIISILSYTPHLYSGIRVGDWVVAIGPFFIYKGTKHPHLTMIAFKIRAVVYAGEYNETQTEQKAVELDLDELFPTEGGEEDEIIIVDGDDSDSDSTTSDGSEISSE